MNDIITGDCLSVLKSLPSESVQMCVTSPPYYGLRSYIPDGHEDKSLEIGLETSPSEYIAKLVAVFREVKRVLRHDGLLFLNLGDSYGTGTKAVRTQGNRGIGTNTQQAQDAVPRVGGMAKQLMMIPARVAIALQEDGYYLRSDIIWHKPNAMPESVTDRCTSSHEHVFMLAKSPHYYYGADAIREPLVTSSNVRNKSAEQWANGAYLQPIGKGEREWNNHDGCNKRDVWTINTKSYASAHFATMPPKLVEPCILAGSRPGDIVLDPFMGAGTVLMVASQLGRDWLGIELNPEYVDLAWKRIATIQPNMWEVSA